ncbi:MAG: M42 family metallopeptidase [Eubacteriales bacterium]
MELKNLIVDLSSLMSIGGFERFEREKLLSMVGDSFDESYLDNVGNQIFVKRCGRDGAPKIMLDAHMDEIGMYVTEILDGGFLRVINIGGIDTGILQASDVIIYGKEERLFGVIASTPPHLASGDNKELPKIDELLIDTCLTKEELESKIRIGTPVGFAPKYTELLGNKIMGKSFDDKACAACAIYAVANTPKDELAGDVYVMLSCCEEVTGMALPGAYAINADYAMSIDVNLGRVPGTKKEETVEIGKGPSITVSAVTDRKLTNMLFDIAKENKIPHQVSVSPTHTGTNAVSIQLAREGIPTVDVGLPLASMHTYNEIISLDDANTLTELVKAFIKDAKIAEHFAKGGLEI